VGHVAYMRKMINAYKILLKKPEENRSLFRLRNGCEEKIKMNLK
jgi:hypothetical protein